MRSIKEIREDYNQRKRVRSMLRDRGFDLR